MKKTDSTFALRWAKKIRSVNYLGGECSKCKNKNIFCLEFHHSKHSKENTISQMLVQGKRWSIIKEELKKWVAE